MLVVVSLALLAPALTTGRVADDYFHQLLQRDQPGISGLEHRPFDLFRFAEGDPQRVRSLIQEGVFPWWADPHARVAFFRPLSSWTHWLDYQLWADRPVMMHAHSMAWFAALLLVVASTYRRLAADRRLFFLALVLFALNDAHAPVVGWIANRNAIISATFGWLSLVAFHRYHVQGCRRDAWLSPLWLALGLLAGESAVSAAAYVFAHAACLGVGSPKQRLRSLLPHAATLLLWKTCCLTLEYGVVGSGVYIDPVASPWTFVATTVERLPVLVLALFGGPFADLWEVYPLVAPALRPWVAGAGWATIVLLIRALWGPLKAQQLTRFWALGTATSLVLSCATFPHDRMLLVPNLGAMMLVAGLVRQGLQRGAYWPRRAGACGLAVIHLMLAPLLLSWRASKVGDFDQVLRASEQTLPGAAQLAGRSLLLLNPPLDPFAAYLPALRQSLERGRPAQQVWLANGHSKVTLCTLTEHRVAVRPSGGYLATASERMLRSPSQPLQLGERVQLDTLEFVVTALTEDKRPASVEIRFDRPVASQHYLWMRWLGQGYEQFAPPPVGACDHFAPADLRALLTGT